MEKEYVVNTDTLDTVDRSYVIEMCLPPNAGAGDPNAGAAGAGAPNKPPAGAVAVEEEDYSWHALNNKPVLSRKTYHISHLEHQITLPWQEQGHQT